MGTFDFPEKEGMPKVGNLRCLRPPTAVPSMVSSSSGSSHRTARQNCIPITNLPGGNISLILFQSAVTFAEL